MPSESTTKGILDEIEDLDAKRKNRVKKAKPEDDDLDLSKVW